MLQLSISLLFVLAAGLSAAVIGHSLRRAWFAAGELRRAIAECDEGTYSLRVVELRRPVQLRLVTSAATTRRMAPGAAATYALPVAA